MTAENRNTILISSLYGAQRDYQNGATPILPGHIIEHAADGTVAPHGTADGPVHCMVALENDLQGKTWKEEYPAGERVQSMVFLPGDEFMGRISSGENIVRGDYLTSNGDGTLKKYASNTAAPHANIIVGIAKESVDMSVSSPSDPEGFCIVEVL